MLSSSTLHSSFFHSPPISTTLLFPPAVSLSLLSSSALLVCSPPQLSSSALLLHFLPPLSYSLLLSLSLLSSPLSTLHTPLSSALFYCSLLFSSVIHSPLLSPPAFPTLSISPPSLLASSPHLPLLTLEIPIPIYQ